MGGGVYSVSRFWHDQRGAAVVDVMVALAIMATIVLSLVFVAVGNARAEGLFDCYKAQGAQEGGDPALAIDYYTRCIAWGGQAREILAGTYNNRGIAYEDKGEYDRAIQDYNEAIHLNPQFAPAYYNRGNAYLAKDEYDRAIQEYDEVIRLDPSFTLAYVNRGTVHQAKDDYDQAIQDYDEAIRLSPRFAHAYYNRGLAHINQGDQDLALWDYNEAVRLDPVYADRPYAEALTRRKPQTKPSTASTPPTTQALEIAPAGFSEVDQKSFAIHLASLRTKDGAKVGWKNLQSQFPELLDQRELIVRSIDLEGQGTFFRIMTGPFQDRTGAQDLCAEFRAFEQYCTVKLVQ